MDETPTNRIIRRPKPGDMRTPKSKKIGSLPEGQSLVIPDTEPTRFDDEDERESSQWVRLQRSERFRRS